MKHFNRLANVVLMAAMLLSLSAQGTHDQLMAAAGTYKHLVDMQTF